MSTVDPRSEERIKTPWNPRIYWPLAFLTGFGAAGVVAGLNYRRLGKPHLMWPTIGISVVGFAALVVGLSFLGGVGGSELMVATAVNLPPAWLLQRLQGKLYEDWESDHPSAPNAGWLIPVGVGASVVAVFFASLFVLYLSRGDLSEAEKHYNRGIDLHATGRSQEAIDEFSMAIALDPEFVEAYEVLGATEIEVGDLEAALADALAAIEIDESRAESYVLAAAAYFELGKTGQAVIAAERARSLSTDDELTAAIEDFLREARGGEPPPAQVVAHTPTSEPTKNGAERTGDREVDAILDAVDNSEPLAWSLVDLTSFVRLPCAPDSQGHEAPDCFAEEAAGTLAEAFREIDCNQDTNPAAEELRYRRSNELARLTLSQLVGSGVDLYGVYQAGMHLVPEGDFVAIYRDTASRESPYGNMMVIQDGQIVAAGAGCYRAPEEIVDLEGFASASLLP